MREGKLDVLVITEGHPYEPEPFFAMFRADPGVEWMQAKQPRASTFFNLRVGLLWDAFVFYDMPGIEFRRGGPPVFHAPPEELVRGIDELAEAGQGMVFLHHAAAGWPAWPAYAEEIIGARFLYQPGRFLGREYPDSGYRHHTWHRVSVVDPDHPVTAGLGEGFDIVDELYLWPVDEAAVTPLLRSDYDFDDVNFSSAALALRGRRGRRDGWSHPRGSNLIGWTRRYRNADIVYLQCGDDPLAYANPGLRRLLGNAIRWVARHRAGGPAISFDAPAGVEPTGTATERILLQS